MAQILGVQVAVLDNLDQIASTYVAAHNYL